MNSVASFREQVTRPVPGSVLNQLPSDCRIAVVRPGRLGDMVVLTPTLRALRRAAPRARVTLVCQRAGKLLEDRLPWVDEVVEIPDHSDALQGDALKVGAGSSSRRCAAGASTLRCSARVAASA